MSSFSLSGGVQVFGFISPSDTTDQYPVIDPLYGIDGFRNVDTLLDLNNIPTLRRRAGMVVGVSGGTTYYKLNLPPWNNTITDWSIFNTGGGSSTFTGGTISGPTEFTNGLTANTISASTYLNLPLDVYVTGGTYSGDTITFTNNTGGTFNVSGITSSTQFTGGTVSGSTEFLNGLTANTISASTYQNLPLDIFVTGGTYSAGTATFTNNSGGTFNVSGFYTGETSYVNSLTTGVGLSGDSTSGNITIINTDPDQVVTISGGTGIVTGGTYPNFEITNSLPDQTVVLNNGSNISVSGTYPNFTIDVTGLTDNDRYVTGYSYNNNTFSISDNSGSTYTATINSVTGLTVNGNLTITGTTTSSTISATTYNNLPIEIQAAASDETTAITAGTAKVTFRAPCGFTLTGVRASLTTAQTSGNIFTADINLNGTSVLSTKLTIDNTERTSTTAATPPVISTSSITDDGEISVDVDQIGDGTAKGLKVTLLGVRS